MIAIPITIPEVRLEEATDRLGEGKYQNTGKTRSIPILILISIPILILIQILKTIPEVGLEVATDRLGEGKYQNQCQHR